MKTSVTAFNQSWLMHGMHRRGVVGTISCGSIFPDLRNPIIWLSQPTFRYIRKVNTDPQLSYGSPVKLLRLSEPWLSPLSTWIRYSPILLFSQHGGSLHLLLVSLRAHRAVKIPVGTPVYQNHITQRPPRASVSQNSLKLLVFVSVFSHHLCLLPPTRLLTVISKLQLPATQDPE